LSNLYTPSFGPCRRDVRISAHYHRGLPVPFSELSLCSYLVGGRLPPSFPSHGLYGNTFCPSPLFLASPPQLSSRRSPKLDPFFFSLFPDCIGIDGHPRHRRTLHRSTTFLFSCSLSFPNSLSEVPPNPPHIVLRPRPPDDL